MTFIVKDLMISVLGAQPRVPLPLDACDAGACTCTPCTGGCSPCTSCTGCTTYTPGGLRWGGGWWWTVQAQADPAHLAMLKQQLRSALAAVEAQEQAALEAMRPKTAEDVERLRTQLTAALEELTKKAEDLKGGGSAP